MSGTEENSRERERHRDPPLHQEPPREIDFPPSTESDMWRRNLKAAMKEAIKEWLDDQFALVGKWSLMAVMAAIFAAALWVVLTSKGWKPPP